MLDLECFAMLDTSRGPRQPAWFAECWGTGEQISPHYKTRYHATKDAALADAERWLRSEAERVQTTATGT